MVSLFEKISNTHSNILIVNENDIESQSLADSFLKTFSDKNPNAQIITVMTDDMFTSNKHRIIVYNLDIPEPLWRDAVINYRHKNLTTLRLVKNIKSVNVAQRVNTNFVFSREHLSDTNFTLHDDKSIPNWNVYVN